MNDYGNGASGRAEIRPSRIVMGLRRLLVISAILSLALAVSTSVAGASAASRVNGSVAGQAPFDFGPRCSFVHQRVIATVDITHGPTASLVLDTCVDFGQNGFVAIGIFTFRAPSGVLTGTLHGTASDDLAPRFDYTLVVTHGTRGFKHASGRLRFTGVWQSNQVNGGPVTGTLTASLTH